VKLIKAFRDAGIKELRGTNVNSEVIR